jgi:transposase
MRRFPNDAPAVCWAGLTPGKNESAGRKRSARTPKGNARLKAVLVQAAHTVARSNDTYLGAQFRRRAARLLPCRAAVAVARSILVIAYHLLRDGTRYVAPGVDYCDKRNQHSLEQHLVTLEPLAACLRLFSRELSMPQGGTMRDEKSGRLAVLLPRGR